MSVEDRIATLERILITALDELVALEEEVFNENESDDVTPT